jgi:hypothetical protein
MPRGVGADAGQTTNSPCGCARVLAISLCSQTVSSQGARCKAASRRPATTESLSTYYRRSLLCTHRTLSSTIKSRLAPLTSPRFRLQDNGLHPRRSPARSGPVSKSHTPADTLPHQADDSSAERSGPLVVGRGASRATADGAHGKIRRLR